MSGIGSLSGSTSSSIRGYGGLASGLDRDSLIEQMTSGTKLKIQNKKKAQQSIKWQQEAMRSISSKLIEFAQKYTSYTSSTNLSSSSFFSQSDVTALGANSNYISVTGSSATAGSMSITGVDQLAQNAKLTSKNVLSDQKIASKDEIQLNEMVSNLEGQSLSFKYGNKSIGVYLGSGTRDDGYTYDYSDPQKAAASMNESFKDVSIGKDRTLADVLEAKVDNSGKIVLQGKTDDTGNSLVLTGGSENVLQSLGILNPTDDISTMDKADLTIAPGGQLALRGTQTLQTQKSLAERLGGKTITFDYNGKKETITLLSKEEIESGGDLDGMLAKVQQDLQNKLNSAFGNGRIKVGLDTTDHKLSFQTINVSQGANAVDGTSTLTLAASSLGVLGKFGALKIQEGTNNRVNTTSELDESGLTGVQDLIASGEEKIKINGKEFDLYERDETGAIIRMKSLKSLMTEINKSDAGVSVSYMKNADKFIIESTDTGASGSVNLDANAATLFGGRDPSPAPGTDPVTNLFDKQEGKDAIIYVKYSNSSDPVALYRGTNSFTLDGLTITVKDKFGVRQNADGTTTQIVPGGSSEAVTFDAKVDVDKITEAVADMVKDFNEMLELVNKEVSKKPDRDYEPLTDEQKAELSEDQIKAWEEKAKAGCLFNDSDLRGLSESLRFIFDPGTEERKKLEQYGISTSTNYSDNGKLVFDEEKFRSALQTDPEGVKELFTKPATDTDSGGMMAHLKAITDKYASISGATKGILVERAGSVYAPTSILKNSMQRQLDELDDVIDSLNDRLETETDRYIKQFTTLETLISQMNSQSSWLGSMAAS